MAAARLSYSNTEAFCSLNWLCRFSENLVLMYQGPVCTLPMTPGHRWLTRLWTRPSGWPFPSLWSCLDVVNSGLAPDTLPNPAPLSRWVLWDGALILEGIALPGPWPPSAPSCGTASPPRLPLVSSSLPVGTYRILWIKEQVVSLMTSLSFRECSNFSAFWCFTRKAWGKKIRLNHYCMSIIYFPILLSLFEDHWFLSSCAVHLPEIMRSLPDFLSFQLSASSMDHTFNSSVKRKVLKIC